MIILTGLAGTLEHVASELDDYLDVEDAPELRKRVQDARRAVGRAMAAVEHAAAYREDMEW